MIQIAQTDTEIMNCFSEVSQLRSLDSGTQQHSAHRFYLNQGVDIASYYFSQTIKRSDI